MKKRNGSVLVIVVVVMAVTMIIGTLITQMVLQNIHSARLQRDQANAYYVAMGGLELGSNALLKRTADPGGGADKYELLEAFQNDYTLEKEEVVLYRDLAYPIADPNDSFRDSESSIAIKMYTVNEKGERFTSAPLAKDLYVQIEVSGIYKKDEITQEHHSWMRYNAENPAITIKKADQFREQ